MYRDAAKMMSRRMVATLSSNLAARSMSPATCKRGVSSVRSATRTHPHHLRPKLLAVHSSVRATFRLDSPHLACMQCLCSAMDVSLPEELTEQE